MTSSQLLTNEHIAANFEMQLSGYYSGVTTGPDGCFYYYSDEIPSLSWNHSVLADPSVASHSEFVLKQANLMDRQATFFVREDDLERVMSALGDRASVARERWMICSKETLLADSTENSLDVVFSHDPVPPQDYCQVLTSLFDDEALNDRFRDFYVPTLRRSKLRSGTTVCHAVGYFAGEPVACGSFYRKNGFAGLYSVGTVASKQKRGFGQQISVALTQAALSSGADDIFLQCVIGTHVERLYASIGYVSAEMPGLISI